MIENNLYIGLVITIVASLLGGIGTLIWNLVTTLRALSHSIRDLVTDFKVFTVTTTEREGQQKMLIEIYREEASKRSDEIEKDVKELQDTMNKKRVKSI